MKWFILILSITSLKIYASSELIQKTIMQYEYSDTIITSSITHQNSQLNVDNSKYSKIMSEHISANARINNSILSIDLGISSLERDIKNYRLMNTIKKNTLIAAPKIEWKVNKHRSLILGLDFIRSDIDLFGLSSAEQYKQNGQRWILATTLKSNRSSTTWTLYSELHQKNSYQAFPDFNQIDREYAPYQLTYDQNYLVTERTRLLLGFKYSHYNHDVYKESYDVDDIPSMPTTRQVLDYLLSFKLGVIHQLSPNLNIATILHRKGALDVNSLTGDEYVRSLMLDLGFQYKTKKNLALTVSSRLSNGKKDHDVNSQTYQYSNRYQSFTSTVSYAF